MDNRKFQSASSASPPAVEASPSTGYPTDGNPSTATPATIPGARWFHQIGEELRNVIASAGLTPSDSDLTQLRQAIAAMTASGVANDFKSSVRIATTANIASLTGLTAVDGVTPIAGDRILVKDQSTGSQNGIYVAAAGAWSRATDADTGAELNGGALISVEEGTINAETIWALTNNGTVTIGSTALVFQWAAGLNGVTAAQFDNSRKLATTEFVKRRGVQFSTDLHINVNTTLDASNAGGLVTFNAGSIVATLPLSSAMQQGTTITLFSTGAGNSVSTQGAENIYVNGGVVTSIALGSGDDLLLESVGSGLGWQAVGGSAHLKYATEFLKYAIGNGQAYQDVSGSRALGTTYTNTTGRPILASVAVGASTSGNSTITATVGGVMASKTVSAYGDAAGNVNFVVPPGVTYSVQVASGPAGSLLSWLELR